GQSLQQEMLDAARPHLLRILGPNCVGLLVPSLGLNASFAHTDIPPGSIAFASQSGALCTVVLDWAKSRGIGFSHFISLGDSLDVDVGDVIDYLGSCSAPRALLLYIETLHDARKFITAARSVSRRMPIIVIKSGRFAAGARAAASHTGALMGNDAVFDAAIQRAGLLRVYAVEELFEAVETLARTRRPRGDRLAIITNGGGVGVMAVDSLVGGGGAVATLQEDTLTALDACLPETWPRANPVDIIGDADAQRYTRAIEAVDGDPGINAILVMLVPSAMVDNLAVAQAVVDVAGSTRKTLLTCWMGEAAVAEARAVFNAAGIATYETPEAAIRAFNHLVSYGRNQLELLETPLRSPEAGAPDRDWARSVIDGALQRERYLLTEPESKALLAAYGIPVVETRIARDVEQGCILAAEIGYPVAVKVLSEDISHKTDVGGVLLDIDDAAELRDTAGRMLERIRELQPDARIDGLTIQQMARWPDAFEIIIGASVDPVFGPSIMFGQGGTAVEVLKDTAVGLPPLNSVLARRIVERTRISALLQGYRNRPPAALDEVNATLIRIADMVVDNAEIIELDINPLLVNSDGVIALDARIRIEPAAGDPQRRLAIRPYPDELEERVTLTTGERVLLRPIRPEDEPAHAVLIEHTDPVDLRFRFFRSVNTLDHLQLARFTQIDYEREMAFIATRTVSGQPLTLGVARSVCTSDNVEAEFAVLVRSDMQRRGVARLLLEKLIRYQRSRGTQRMVGQVLRDNSGMLGLAAAFGFEQQRDGTDIVTVTLRLNG
ncbi:MAG: GNAT family N-acetyltransferase, partial [Gammaproteobacteria bacterium]|nr:GNAT family N-acetyltransferase [Gammaproteobacteria bacterium]